MQTNSNDKNKVSFWSGLPDTLKAIAAIITAIGGLAGLLLALDQLGALDRFKPVPAPTSTSVPVYGWQIWFEEKVNTTAWRLGDNYYELTVDCPEIGDIKPYNTRVDFAVDPNARLFPDKVLDLR